MDNLGTYLEKLGFELVEDGTDALNYGVTVYELLTEKEFTRVTIDVKDKS